MHWSAESIGAFRRGWMVFQSGKLHPWSDSVVPCTVGVGEQNLPRLLRLQGDWNQQDILPSIDCPSSGELRAHSPCLLQGHAVQSCIWAWRWTRNNWRSNPEDHHSWVQVRTSLTWSRWGRISHNWLWKHQFRTPGVCCWSSADTERERLRAF